MTKFGFKTRIVLQALFILCLFSMISAHAESVSGAASSINSSDTILTVIFAAAVIVGFLLFVLFGTEKRINPTEENSPPEGLSPVEASSILNGQGKALDIALFISNWANKGYLSINNVSEGGTEELELVKRKDADNAMTPYEKRMFEEIFSGQKNVPFTNLKEQFNLKLGKVSATLSRMIKGSAKGLFTRGSTIAAIACTLFAALSIGILPVYTAVIQHSDLVAGIVGGILALLITVCFCSVLRYFRTMNKKWFFYCIAVYIVYLLFVAVMFVLRPVALMACVEAAVCGILSAFIKKHTDWGRDLIAKMLGLATFMTTSDQGRIETHVQENPSLFYNLLPFAYAFGIADIWAGQFENIPIAKPDWYTSDAVGEFNPVYFTKLFDQLTVGKQIFTNGIAITAYASNTGFQPGGNPHGGPS